MQDRIAFALLAAVVTFAGITDWRHGQVYNRLTYPAMLVGLLYWAACGMVNDGMAGAIGGLGNSLVALAAGLIPVAIIFAMGALGGGDVKLMGAVGAISASPQMILNTACYGFLLAALMAVILMIKRRIVGATLQRIYLAVLSVFVKTRPLPLSSDGPRIPFSTAIAACSDPSP